MALGGDAGRDRAARPAGTRPVAPKLSVLADRLSDRFETRVKVDLGRSKGRIVVEFASIDDLERIVALMAPDTEVPADVASSRLTGRRDVTGDLWGRLGPLDDRRSTTDRRGDVSTRRHCRLRAHRRDSVRSGREGGTVDRSTAPRRSAT